jgi:hydrogenase nickel incorporation protein HypA/HybF
MHELAIAESIVRIACDHAGDRRVIAVDLRVGHLRQVVPSALTFAFELVAQGTPVEGAELTIEEIAAAGRCRACGSTSVQADFPLQCERCGGLDLELIAGEELLVEALELEEVVTTTGGMGDGD